MPHIPGRKAAEQLGIHQNTLRRCADEGRIQTIRTPSGQGRYDVDAFLRESRDATLVCYCRVSSAKQRDDLARQVAVMRETYGETYPGAEIVTDIGGGLNFRRKGLVALLERLHGGAKLRLVVAHAHKDRLARFGFDLIRWQVEQKRRRNLGSRRRRITAPSRNSPRIFSPSGTPSVAGCTACAATATQSSATATQSRRIRVYPTGDQRRTLRLWFDAARWCYNEAVARRRRTGEPANWKAIKTEIIHAVPERLRAAPYEVKSISVRDDCRAVSEVRRRNRRLAKRNKYRAASRMRVRIGNLTDELHHQAARWLVDNFDVILLPTFETSDMARRGARKLRSKSVRSLLTYAHYQVPEVPDLESMAGWERTGAGQRGLHKQDLQLVRGNNSEPGRTSGSGRFRWRPGRPGHQRRPRDIPADFGRYPCPAPIRAGVHRQLRC